MGSLGLVRITDDQQRQEALDPRRSFIVQAPAGSGKTELLIQRYLRLLGTVEKPERILAMTFTRKAAAEMRERVLGALGRADAGHAPSKTHETITHKLALAALERGRSLGWDLLENPGRVQVQTIDSVCGSIVAQMPWLARQGALPEVVEDAGPLYMSAAQRTVLMVERDGPHRGWIEHLLLHRDNKAKPVAELIAAMLAKRDQWIQMAVNVKDDSRAEMEQLLTRVVREGYESIDRVIPERDLTIIHGEFGDWPQAVEGLLTKGGDLRKKIPNHLTDLFARLSTIDGLAEELKFVRKLPPERYTNGQWKTVRSLLETLKIAAAQLRLAFQEAGTIDFCEMGLAARRALGEAGDPSDLALKLDARIEHLLIDEFQDTSEGQFELATQLVEGWEPGDGRTIFLVGDPMQSIYRFRQAEVGLFLKTVAEGIGAVQPQPLLLSANYRSSSGIVDWVNRVFRRVFPAVNDLPAGAVEYSASYATQGNNGTAVTLHAFSEKDWGMEARRVVELVRRAREEDESGTVAVLVRARTHLPAIIDALKRADLSFRAVKIDDLNERQGVRDLLSLTRAMLHLGDRVAWLAILRAPWCGLKLGDLHALAGNDEKALVYDLLHADITALSQDGRERLFNLRTVIDEAFSQRGRVSLRVWIERAWRALGGPACLQTSGEVKDAADYFELLEREESGGELSDFDGFAARVKLLKAEPDPQADERLQVMTIHEAKGLQFDTVILPGTGRNSGRDDQSLFLYHEGLMAPIAEIGTDGDPVYDYLLEIEKRKSKNEVVRQLYVAATRAKKRLHLLGYAGANGKPCGGSMLAVLWNGFEPEEQELFIDVAATSAVEEVQDVKPAAIRRLPVEWAPKPTPKPVKWEGSETEINEMRQPTFEWVGDSLRHAGTVVHALLQRMAKSREHRVDEAVIRTALTQLGVPAAELDRTTRRVEDALARTVASTRGQWILTEHDLARCEVPLAGVLDGKIVRGTVDRTFVDRDGTRWVIDFKTSAHEGGGLVDFLDEQQRRYRTQLERYGRLLGELGQPVRLGLYFPLLNEWREWSI